MSVTFGKHRVTDVSGFTQGSVLFASASGLITQDNSNFYWNDTTFNLGLGLIPATNITLDTLNATGTSKAIQSTNYGVGSTTPFRGRFARGTVGTPTAAQAGDSLSTLSGRGYGTSQFATASTGAINIVANETFTNTSNATYLQFEVTPTSSITIIEKMRLNSTGNLLLNTTTDSGVAQIQSQSTQAQLQLLHDSANYSLFTVGSTNDLTIAPTTDAVGSTGRINLLGATGPSSGTIGGSINITGGSGTAATTGGPGGAITITAGSGTGNQTLNNAAGGITLVGGTSNGNSTGGGIGGNAGTGGTGTGTAGANGGTIQFTGGTGGAGSATSGNGGNATYTAGKGGAGVGGGNGGTAVIIGGTGGAGSSTGGNGGTVEVTGGGAAAVAGASGGPVIISAGAGTSTGSGGAGGGVTINGANAGGDNTANQAGGTITITGGTSKGSSAGAAVAVNAGTGGLGTGTTGATGGQASISGGTGGAGSATGGAGGGLLLRGGIGGTSTANGAGGGITIQTAATTSYTDAGFITKNGLWGFGNNLTPTYLVDVLGSTTTGHVGVATAGCGYRTKEGANAKQGTATLSAGTVTVANTSVTASSRIFLTIQSLGTVTVPQPIGVTARTPATSFTISSATLTDTSVIAYEIFEPY